MQIDSNDFTPTALFKTININELAGFPRWFPFDYFSSIRFYFF